MEKKKVGKETKTTRHAFALFCHYNLHMTRKKRKREIKRVCVEQKAASYAKKTDNRPLIKKVSLTICAL